MKKVFYFFVLSLWVYAGFISDSLAQKPDSLKVSVSTIKRFYWQFGTGYGFNAGTDYMTEFVQKKDGSYTAENIKGSWGKGFDIGLAFGGKFNSSLGVEVEFGYTVGGKNTTNSQYYITDVTYPLLVKETKSARANTIRVNPKLVFEMPFLKVNAIYGKLGYFLGTGNAIVEYQEEWVFDNGGYGSASYQHDFYGGTVSGSTLALGIRVKAEQDISFFAEMTGNTLHRKFEYEELTRYTANGKDFLADFSYYDRRTNFVDKAQFDGTTINENKPRELPSFLSNYSTAGFRFGLVKHF